MSENVQTLNPNYPFTSAWGQKQTKKMEKNLAGPRTSQQESASVGKC